MIIKYTLSIEDKVGTGVNVTERLVAVKGSNGFDYEKSYNPNAETKPFNSKDTEFDTSFTIVHSFNDVAQEVMQDYRENGGVGVPNLRCDYSINDAQKKLFGNILLQEYEIRMTAELMGALAVRKNE